MMLSKERDNFFSVYYFLFKIANKYLLQDKIQLYNTFRVHLNNLENMSCDRVYIGNFMTRQCESVRSIKKLICCFKTLQD